MALESLDNEPLVDDTNNDSVGVTLAFAPPLSDPQLSVLRDESSSFAQVAKACLHINSFAGTGSSSSTVADLAESSSPVASDLLHDPSFAQHVSSCFDSLLECLASHRNRTCRILAINTLAILARSAYARIRQSPLLYSQRESVPLQLEDEVCTDIPAALAAAALDEPDNGVSSKALQALALLTLSTSSVLPGATDADDLFRSVNLIAFAHISAYAPTLRAVVDEDPGVAMADLQARIFDQILDPPRVGQMMERVRRYDLHSHQVAALPILAASILHQLSSHNIIVNAFGMDRMTYAKRWSDVDTLGWVRVLAETLLLPLLSSHSNDFAICAATYSVRILARVSQVHATKPDWFDKLALTTATVLQSAVLSTSDLYGKSMVPDRPLEEKMTFIATWLIALRGLRMWPDRYPHLINLVNAIATLPFTTTVPAGVYSAGIDLCRNNENGVQLPWRRPARMGFWTQVALQFFIDGPVGETLHFDQNSSSKKEISQQETRSHALQQFLQSGPVVKLLSKSTLTGIEIACGSGPREEFALAFLSVAIEAGRRLRIGPDGTLQVVVPTAEVVYEWTAMSRSLLSIFSSFCCRTLSSANGKTINFLDEDLSITTAMQATYVQLLQEHLHFVGLLLPASSVALKLTSNACPPHLLWDQLGDSAAFLSSFETEDIEEIEGTSKLMEMLVGRELKYGIESHYMRIFILALAADQWGQGRICAIRQQFEKPAAPSPTPQALNAASGRDICLAFSPKRILTKMFESYIPPADVEGKKRKDPMKKLALEAVKVCVACIENIALIACDWRRRFGSSQECKHLVSVAVGTLQGKIDETPIDDNIRSIITPTCDAAISRIQLFYESDGGDPESFPVSEIITLPVRTKIKPLISSSRPPLVSDNDFLKGYLMQLSRQIIGANTEEALLAFPIADPLMSPAKSTNYYRLNVPPITESKDARHYGHRGEMLSAWGQSVVAASAPSDPCAIVFAYTPRKYLRYDGEERFALSVLFKVFNMTAVDILEGLRLELRISHDHDAGGSHKSSTDTNVVEALGGDAIDLQNSTISASSSAVYRQELKAGEYLTWEIGLSTLDLNCGIKLWPTLVYRNIPVEPIERGAKWVGDSTTGEASTVTGGESKSGEDDFQVTKSENGGNEGEATASENIAFSSSPLAVSPFACLQPCPLVFFRNSWGDADAFRFLWFRMPYHLPIIQIYLKAEVSSNRDSMSEKIATMSSLTWAGEAIPGGYASQAWAFMSLNGSRVLVVLSELSQEDDANQNIRMTLTLRGDSKCLLYRLTENHQRREKFVSTLIPNASQLA